MVDAKICLCARSYAKTLKLFSGFSGEVLQSLAACVVLAIFAPQFSATLIACHCQHLSALCAPLTRPQSYSSSHSVHSPRRVHPA